MAVKKILTQVNGIQQEINADDTTETLLDGIAASGATSERNKVINPDFAIDQIYNGAVAEGRYNLWFDPWYVGARAGAVDDIVRAQRITLDNYEGTNGRTGLAFGFTAEPTDPSVVRQIQVYQRIEGVQTLAGSFATFSFMLDIPDPDAVSELAFFYMQYRGSGGVGRSTLLTPVAGRNRYTATVFLPAVTVSATELARRSNLEVSVRITTSSAQVFQLTDAQLEEGKVATPIARRNPTLELSMVQRFLTVIEATAAREGFGTAKCNTAAVAYATFNLMPPMRAAPSVSIEGTLARLDGANFRSVSAYSSAAAAVTLSITSVQNEAFVVGNALALAKGSGGFRMILAARLT